MLLYLEKPEGGLTRAPGGNKRSRCYGARGWPALCVGTGLEPHLGKVGLRGRLCPQQHSLCLQDRGQTKLLDCRFVGSRFLFLLAGKEGDFNSGIWALPSCTAWAIQSCVCLLYVKNKRLGRGKGWGTEEGETIEILNNWPNIQKSSVQPFGDVCVLNFTCTADFAYRWLYIYRWRVVSDASSKVNCSCGDFCVLPQASHGLTVFLCSPLSSPVSHQSWISYRQNPWGHRGGIILALSRVISCLIINI